LTIRCSGGIMMSLLPEKTPSQPFPNDNQVMNRIMHVLLFVCEDKKRYEGNVSFLPCTVL
jgi:hypothetical protein